jgi:hypothetical protein
MNNEGPAPAPMEKRQQILNYLKVHGAIVDPKGLAARQLGQAIQSNSTSSGLAQLLAAMERAGQIHREIRGKRTYLIALGRAPSRSSEAMSGPAGASPTARPEAGGLGRASATTSKRDLLASATSDAMVPLDLMGADIDYDELALALLRRVARSLNEPADLGASNLGAARAQRRIVNLERRINEMERSQARTHAENVQLGEENADLRTRLEAASQTIDTLMGQLDHRRGSVARQRLDAGDIAVLDRLTRTSPSARIEGSQVG